MWNLVKITQEVSVKKFKNYTILYIAQGQGQITPMGQKFDCNWKVYYFNHTLFQSLVFNTFFFGGGGGGGGGGRGGRRGKDNLALPKKGQKSPYDHYLNKLCRSWVPNAIYQDSVPKFSWFGVRGIAAVLINGSWSFEQIFSPPPTWSLKKIGPGV